MTSLTVYHFATDYMEVFSASMRSGTYVAMTSPTFDASREYCLSFDFGLLEALNLEIYIRALDAVMAGKRIWQWQTSSRPISHQWLNGSALVNIIPNGNPNTKIDFVGIIGSEKTIIRLTNVVLREGLCVRVACAENEFSCSNSGQCVPRVAVCNGRSECGDESDEAAELCGTYVSWWRHQMETFSALLALCAPGIHRSSVNPPHKGQWRRALMFSLICVWITGSVNDREDGDLRRHRAHSDVSVMFC